MKTLGKAVSDAIEWSRSRLICIAGDFTKYDEHAVLQINRKIDLMRYVRFGDEFLLLEMVSAVTSDEPIEPINSGSGGGGSKGASTQVKSVEDQISKSSPELLAIFPDLETHLSTFGDDIQKKVLKWYIAFKRVKSFRSVVFQHAQNRMLVFVKLDPDSVQPTSTTGPVSSGEWCTDRQIVGFCARDCMELFASSR